MSARALRCLSGVLLVVLVGLGAAGCRRLRPGVDIAGEREQVTVHNTLPPLVQALSAPGADPKAVWREYQALHAARFAEAGLAASDELPVEPARLLPPLRALSAHGPDDVRAVVEVLEGTLGPLPRTELVLAAVADGRPLAVRGGAGRGGLVVVDAVELSLTEEAGRRAAVARGLVDRWQRVRSPEGTRLSPLAQRVWREGAGALAAQLVAPEQAASARLLLSAKQHAALSSRRALIARELLAQLDAGGDAPLERFSGTRRDPLLPPHAGRYISDALFAQLAKDLGSPARALRLSPTEFLHHARPALRAIAEAPGR